jgi:hypothetical protein
MVVRLEFYTTVIVCVWGVENIPSLQDDMDMSPLAVKVSIFEILICTMPIYFDDWI